LEQWLWLWGGSSFGYREAGELWTYDGHHVGRFRGREIYAPDGLYLGEVQKEKRLLIDLTKKARRMPEFSPLPGTSGHAPVFGFNSIALPAGYEEFPRPGRLH
jgi:hypothetical protein